MQLIKGILVCIVCFCVNVWAEDAVSINAKETKIQKILNNWRAQSGIPSATLSILLPDQNSPMTFTSGATVSVGGEKIRSDTLFQAGSITKSFTSVIILQLEAEKKLNLNDSITKYLPQYTRWQNVTIRQLLNHTSGIFNYTTTGTFNTIRKVNPQAEMTPEEIVNMANGHRNYFPPGKGWKYSNTNYVLAGMIIQKVTGQSIDKIMDYYLHGGLKLNLLNTYYLSGLYSNALMVRMAHGYDSDGQDVTSHNMSWANTAGAIVTTTLDLLTWWHGLFQNKILPAQQMAEMMSLVCEGESPNCNPGQATAHFSHNEVGKGYGLGIIQSAFGSDRVGSVWWHNGSTKGYKAIVMWYPKSNIYMALMINKDPGYLLKPNIPIIQRILNVLIPGAETASVSHKTKKKHLHSRKSNHIQVKKLSNERKQTTYR